MTGALIFLVATALVGTSATLGVSLLGLRNRLDVVLAWALLASTTIIATLLFAGAVLQNLAVWLVLVLNAAVTGLVLLVWVARGLSFPSLRHRSLAGPNAVLEQLRGDLWLSLLLAVALFEVVWRVVIAYLLPPYAGDALWYHLTTVAGWLQADRIGPSSLSIWSTVHPQNGELLFTWPALLLETDTLVDAVQLPFAVVAAVAVAGVGRTAGLSRRGAAAAGCLFLLTPIVLSQTTANYTDVIFIAFFLTAFHFLLRYLSGLHAQGTDLPLLLLAGLGAGLAIGTKSLGLLYVSILLVALVASVLAARLGRRLTARNLAWSLVGFAGVVVAVGSYHYIETWIRFGNPVHPVRVEAFGFDFFGGRSIDEFLSTPPAGGWWREVWGQWHDDYFFLVHPRVHAYSYDGRPSGLGPLWSYLGLPVLVGFALRLAWTRSALLLSLMLPVVAMFVLQPYRWWSRFTMILVAVAVIGIVALVEALPTRWSTVLKSAVIGLVALGVAFPTLKIDGEFWATRILGVARIPIEERTIGRIALSGYHWVDEIPSGATIGVDTSAANFGGQPSILAYPLFGDDFEHSVHPLPDSGKAEFQRAIAKRQMDYVFVRRGGDLDRWSEQAALRGCARRVYDGPVYAGSFGRAYLILPECDLAERAP